MTNAFCSPESTLDSETTPARKDESSRRSDGARQTVVVIDRRAFSRECLAGALRASASNLTVLMFSSVQDYVQHSSGASAPSLVLLCTGSRKARDEDLARDITLLTREAGAPALALLSDEEDPSQVIAALDRGVRGYIPTSLPLDVAVEAMHLVRAGGTYIPASSLLSCRRSLETSPQPSPDASGGVFTTRQTAVLRALREGKANKLIAYELNMRESTVKVHVRNIMKKLKARNRTEVAYKTSEFFPETSRY